MDEKNIRQSLSEEEANAVSGGASIFSFWILCKNCRNCFRNDEAGGKMIMVKDTGTLYYECPGCGKFVDAAGNVYEE